MTQFTVGNLARERGFAKGSNTTLRAFQPGNFSRIETSIPLPASSWTGMGRGAKGALSHYYRSFLAPETRVWQLFPCSAAQLLNLRAMCGRPMIRHYANVRSWPFFV
jgi:hypothetical protein